MDDLLDLRRDIEDAADLLRRAAGLAYRLSGEDPGREPGRWFERCTCPACNGTGRGVELDADGVPGPTGRCCACGGVGTYTLYHHDRGEPAEPGWPALVALSDTLSDLAGKVAAAVTDEVRKAMDDEAAYQDEMSDRADAQSY